MHHVIIQAHDGPKLKAVLDYLDALGVTRVVYPGREYRSKMAGDSNRRRSKSLYETARLLPRGDDGGFAERFIEERSSSRDT